MASESQNALPELGSHTQPRPSVWSGVISNISRPPSYDTVSYASLSGEETARRAREKYNTDVKSLVSAGDRPSLDDTQIKRLEAEEDFFDVEEYPDAKSVYFDVHSESPVNLMQAIEELQKQQESLKALHADHDRKLAELLRRQPSVNEQFKIIRQHSVKPSSRNKSIPENRNQPTNCSSNASGRDKGHKEDKDSQCGLEGENGARSKDRSSDDDNNCNNKCGTQGKLNSTAKSSDGVIVSTDQVIHRKPSKTGLRNENELGAFRRMLFSEEQHRVYVQLEKLYTNFQRLHVPTKTVQTLMEGNLLCATDSTVDLLCESLLAGGAVGGGDGNWNSEERRLHRENKELKLKNEQLKRDVDEIKKQMEGVPNRRMPPPIPPKPDLLCHSPSAYSSARRKAIKRSVKPIGEDQLNFVSGRPTSPLPRHARPQDIDIREIGVQHKIENYSHKLNEEKLQEGQKQVSSSFYTSHGGCRAQLEVFLNGNGTGRDRCMSLFLRVVPGVYDDTIKWPVTLHIRATLMNQRRGLSHSLEDQGNQFQFKKPKSCSDGDSDCWGLVEFVNHKMISQPGFIKDDAIVLRCKIMINSSLN
ncbi:hypothetical protein RRG08_021521 [Elysia crispata]|uniref:MATH domain-containing protein n=1 Tax=Elysia crispata TaxID=231223 RepID=A0AAE1EF02_9GAST|nr:hypothetical protein RRG08_021521 [Elysia crispata]